MDDKEKNISPEQQNEAPRNPKEDIPLWLQGLEEETQANRLKAEMDKNTEPVNDETVFDSFPDETSFEEHDSFETISEDTDSDNEDFISVKNIPDLIADSGKTDEVVDAAVDNVIEIEGFDSLKDQEPDQEFSLTDLTSDSLEAAASNVEDETVEAEEHPQEPVFADSQFDSPESTVSIVEDEILEEEEQNSPIEITSQDILPADSSIEILELSETSLDEMWSKDAGSTPSEESVQGDSLIEAQSALSDPEEDSFEPSEPDEDESTEEISIQPLDEPGEEPDDLEWVSEVPEPADELTEFEEEHTQPQSIFEEKYHFSDDESEPLPAEPSNPAESNQFLDISGATFENEQIVPLDDRDDSSLDEQSIGWQEEEETQQVKGRPFGESDLTSADDPLAFSQDKIIPDDEGLIFINDEITSYDEMDQFSEEELLPDDEDLPKWLQRLIADSYPDDESDEYPVFEDDTWEEITKPVVITPEEPISEDLEEVEKLDEVELLNEIEEVEDFDLISELEEIEPEETIDIPEEEIPSPIIEEENLTEDTSPVQIAVEELESFEKQEPIEWTEEDNLYFNPENGYVIDIPEPLQFARQVLFHGDVSQALEIINKYIAEGSFLDEIRLWLTETADSKQNHKSEIWESLGDIAASQDNHKEALSAYSKAINLLLVNKDENGTC